MVSAKVPSLPTRWQMLAGIYAATVLGAEGTPWSQLHPSLMKLPTDGLYRHDDMLRGLQILREAGLIEEEDGVWIPGTELRELRTADPETSISIVTFRWMSSNPPLWLHTAIRLDMVAPELIPSDDDERLNRLLPDPQLREALLLAAADKVDIAARNELGSLGEELVAETCRKSLRESGRQEKAARVKRVSRISDALGYDVTSPRLRGARTCRMEVKTTRSRGPAFVCYLSRGEARVGSCDDCWYLVVCRKNFSGLQIIGWTTYNAICHLLPRDNKYTEGAQGCWASVRLVIPRHYLRSGLPIDAPNTT